MTFATVGAKARTIADSRRSETRALRHQIRQAALAAIVRPRQALGLGSLPDFVIAGAQRSGTTSLYETMQSHPQVAPLVLGIKGVHYYDTDGGRPASWYEAHFPSDRARRRRTAAGSPIVAGEASPYYFFHPTALERLAVAAPETKVIVLLRHPVARAVSHYRHMVWEGHEPLPTLEEALAAEDERLAGQAEIIAADPSAVSEAHQHYSYVARSLYADQVRRAQRLLGDRLKIMISEDLFADPGRGVAEICRFIGIDSHVDLELPQANSTPGRALDDCTLDRLHARFDPEMAELESMLGRPVPWRRRDAA